ncbi:hypothetical protein FVEG_00455 [Fusarium verticillioides 7600]|uniref:Uncharacterized protein n=1 Tax=Gibberella moniliformis (strain M3125 / FGSC 7600) TaxID=334819 RepID=W7LLX4_GIBM7|nr:hypothetical protein FVEG_00455 [Fusarium verticillioides 7600]EWG36399.1 hypothetical protein FVEG_00455 [Fusarium verticillioides 7600]
MHIVLKLGSETISEYASRVLSNTYTCVWCQSPIEVNCPLLSHLCLATRRDEG